MCIRDSACHVRVPRPRSPLTHTHVPSTRNTHTQSAPPPPAPPPPPRTPACGSQRHCLHHRDALATIPWSWRLRRALNLRRAHVDVLTARNLEYVVEQLGTATLAPDMETAVGNVPF
eukprot:4442951-Prymnesium_polylepis.1